MPPRSSLQNQCSFCSYWKHWQLDSSQLRPSSETAINPRQWVAMCPLRQFTSSGWLIPGTQTCSLPSVRTTLNGCPIPELSTGSPEVFVATALQLNLSLCPVLLPPISSRYYSWQHPPINFLYKHLHSESFSQETNHKEESVCEDSSAALLNITL